MGIVARICRHISEGTTTEIGIVARICRHISEKTVTAWKCRLIPERWRQPNKSATEDNGWRMSELDEAIGECSNRSGLVLHKGGTEWDVGKGTEK